MKLPNRTPECEPEADHVSFLVHETSRTRIQEPIREEISWPANCLGLCSPTQQKQHTAHSAKRHPGDQIENDGMG